MNPVAVMTASEELQSTTIEETQVAVGQITQGGRWLSVNRELCELVGFSESELEQMDPCSLELAEGTRWRKLCARIRTDTSIYAALETRFIRGDGRLIWVQVTVAPVQTEAAATLVVLVDITTRKRREQRLAAEYAVSQVLANAGASGYEPVRVLQAICESLNWAVGLSWRTTPEQDALVVEQVYTHHTSPAIAEFIENSRTRPLTKGNGAAGTCWAGEEAAVLLPDLRIVPHEGRNGEALDAGLRIALAFIVYTGNSPCGVMEFYGRNIYTEADAQELLRTVELIARELSISTGRTRTREALQESNERFRRLTELAREGILVHADGVLIDANPSLLKMFGYELSDLVGKNVFDLIATKAECDELLIDAHSISEETMEIEVRRKDGSTFPVEITSRPIMMAGKPLQVATVRDITERREMDAQAIRLAFEQAARAEAEDQQQKMEFLAEATRILGSSFDYNTTMAQLAHVAVPIFADWTLVYAPREDGTFERLGFAHRDPEMETLLGQIAFITEGRVRDNHPIMQVLRTGETIYIPDCPPDMIDSYANDEAHAAVLRKLDIRSGIVVPLIVGERVFAALTLIMSTSGRRFDERDLALAENLARRAAIAIEHAQLYDQAQQATKARDEMLGVVAHDLRNPLNTIVMGADFLQDLMTEGHTDIERRQFVILQRAAKRMNDLIQDLLDVRRMDTGSLVIEARPEPVATVLEDVLDMLQPLAAASCIDLTVSADDDQQRVLVDPARLQQVFSNLVGNAIKFTPANGTIKIRAEAAEAEVQFAVADSGPGIPPEQLPHVFGRFFQGDKTDRRGIGLGLSIAQAIIEAHGGRIWVESRVGEGSTFLFTVPCVR